MPNLEYELALQDDRNNTESEERARFEYYRAQEIESELELAQARIAELESEKTAIEKGLQDQTTIHVNMLRGGIARLSLSNVEHLYQDEVFKIPRVSARIAELEVQSAAKSGMILYLTDIVERLAPKQYEFTINKYRAIAKGEKK